jgi:acetolactate synthase-1/2/3 large subunit
VQPEYRETTGAVHPYVFVDEVSEHLREGDVVVTANGAASVVTFQALRMKPLQRLLANSGTASMGYDLPAAIGAAFAHDRRVVCMAGDGSLMMNVQELQTLVHHKLPVKLFVFDNDGYLSIRQTQDNLFGGHYVGEGPASGVTLPDFVAVAEAFGIPARRITSHAEMAGAIEWALAEPGPALLDVVMPRTQPFAPKVVAEKRPDGTIVSKPLEDMFPFLSRDEFAENMLVPLWDSP